MPILDKPDAIIFDCDSTLSKIEGIDELARLKNVEKEVIKLTNQAMDGLVPLESVYKKRLDIIHPSKEQILAIADQYIEQVTEGALDFIKYLKEENIRVAIISGGLREAILPFAEFLGIHTNDVYAVPISFDKNNQYQSVMSSPLTTAGGKRQIAAKVKSKYDLKNMYLIGDGMSDIAAKGEDAANKIIGYGGVIYRDKVMKNADVFYKEENLLNIKRYWE